MFGRKPMNPYAGGVDPAALDMSLPQDPYANERPAEAPGFFGKGRKFRDAIGYGLGAFAEALGGAENPYRTAMNEDRRAKNELVQAQLLAQIRAASANQDSPFVRDARAIGLTPGTPEFARWVTRMRSAPRVVTNDSGTYQIDNDNYGLWNDQGGGGAAMGGLAPGTVQDGYVFLGGDPSQPGSWRKQ